MKRIAKALGIASLLLAAAAFRLWNVYSYTRPRFAYPEYGQIYALDTHGWVVYLTKSEQNEFYGTAILAIVCLVVAIACDLFAPRPEPRPARNARD